MPEERKEERTPAEEKKLLGEEQRDKDIGSVSAGRTWFHTKPKRSFDFGKWRKWCGGASYLEPFDPDRDYEDFWYRDEVQWRDGRGWRYSWLADLYAFPNWSLACHYFNVGVALNLLATPVSFYLVESLDASAAVTNTYAALTYLPWCLKVFFGLQSDLVPLWREGEPGIASTLLLSFVMTMGCLMSDTVADAIILECTTAGEAEADTGRMRTHGYLVRQLPVKLKGDAKALWRDMWNFVANDGVWVPLMYLYFYNLCFVSNPAWYNFLYDGLDFSNFAVGMLYTVGSLLSVVGLYVYEKVFFKTAWRPLYLWVTVISAGFSLLQVLLVTGETFGLPKILFATGDVSLQDFVQMLTFIPMCAMIPKGTEGTAYAMLSTWQNVAAEVGYDVGTSLDCGVNVSNSALEKGNWTGVLKLTIICGCIQFLPVFGIYVETPRDKVKLLPNDIAETTAQCERGRSSWWGAFAFFFLFSASIVVSLGQALYVIYYPNGARVRRVDRDSGDSVAL
ncbi:BT1-like protein [Aureococcus anophagefferens]|nr:BT1-like protein [Aureococcus anophagefferens]